MKEILNLKISKTGHDGFFIEHKKTKIYIDPYKIQEKSFDKADLIFITHEHFDHCSIEDIQKIIKKATIIIAPFECKPKLDNFHEKVLFVEPNNSYKEESVHFKTYPAYNLNKFRSPGQLYHPKEENKVSYYLIFKDKTLFHCGDSDFIEEFKELKNKVDILLIPVSGTYVMDSDEAAKMTNYIKPKYAIPMHYGEIIGTKDDAKQFSEKVDSEIKVEIL